MGFINMKTRKQFVELEKDVFFVLSWTWDKEKNSESLRGIKPQTFRFSTLMLYHWATETLWWVRSTMKFIWLVSVLHTTRSMEQIKNSESLQGIESRTIKLFCHKTKTKVSSIRVMENGTESHWGLYVKTSKHPEEQENVDDKVASGFLIVSDRLRGLSLV